YSFNTSDGRYWNWTASYTNLTVTETNVLAPWLVNASVTPSIGRNDTLFNFTAWCFESENNTVRQVNITINGTTFSMTQVDPGDVNSADGILFSYVTTLDWGFYEFQVDYYDGVFSNTSGLASSPEVNPFYNTGTFIIFEDDFEDGSLGSDWSISGTGGVGTQTSNSGIYSAYHNGDSGSITSRVIDLDGYFNVSISYWVRRGSSSFSELPDSGEDFVVEYYNDIGSWVILDMFLGGGLEGEIFARNHVLPADALHSNFQIRFRQTGGSGNIFDYWHFDDVIITAIGKEVKLLFPSDGGSVVNGPVIFSWTSIELPSLTVNYTWQLSNTSNFSTVLNEVAGIPETTSTTTTTVNLDLPSGIYYWRVLPTYGLFQGEWSECYSLNMLILPPQSTHPADQIVLEGASSTTISWQLTTSYDNGEYRILKNGSVYLNWQAWSGGNFVVNITTPSDMPAGIYNFTLEYYDLMNNGTPDTVFLVVNDIPVLTRVDNIGSAPIERNSGDVYLNWTITDTVGGYGLYRVLKDGLVITGWTNWRSGDNIVVLIDVIQDAGDYNYTIEFMDVYGQMGSPESVIITLTSTTNQGSRIFDDSQQWYIILIIGAFIGTVTTVIVVNKKKKMKKKAKSFIPEKKLTTPFSEKPFFSSYAERSYDTKGLSKLTFDLNPPPPMAPAPGADKEKDLSRITFDLNTKKQIQDKQIKESISPGVEIKVPQLKFFCNQCNQYFILQNPDLSAAINCPSCKVPMFALNYCEHCGQSLAFSLDDYREFRGKTIKCPVCSKEFILKS
ncbi:MAG: hypothetical protein ACTSRA_18830, partial [Promethearchaeota archaeon]